MGHYGASVAIEITQWMNIPSYTTSIYSIDDEFPAQPTTRKRGSGRQTSRYNGAIDFPSLILHSCDHEKIGQKMLIE